MLQTHQEQFQAITNFTNDALKKDVVMIIG